MRVLLLAVCGVLLAAMVDIEMAYGDESLIWDPKGLVADDALEVLWEEGGFTEGAAAGPDGAMYFSDFAQPFDARPARIMKFDPASGNTTIHCADSKMGNGLMFTRDGRLLACCASPLGGARALVEITPDGNVKPIQERFNGKRFNSPNDLVIARDGTVFFTDPKYVGPEELELDGFYVYKMTTDGKVSIATAEIDKPNGIVLSPDQRHIYIAETDNGSAKADLEEGFKPGRMTLNMFRLKDGELSRRRVLHDFGDQTGVDGMTVDRDGRVYAAVRSSEDFGLWIFSSKGKVLAKIKTPTLPTNCSFGKGDEAKRLYITAGGGFYRIRMNTIGYHPAID